MVEVCSRFAPSLRRLGSWFIPSKERPAFQFSERECAALLAHRSGEAVDALDEQSWRDLLGLHYFEHVAASASIFGKQVLYERLHAGCSRASRRVSIERIGRLRDDPDAHRRLDAALEPLYQAETEIGTLLFDPAALQPVPRWLGAARWLPVWLGIGVGLALFAPAQAFALAGLIGTIASLAVMFYLHMHCYTAMGIWQGRMQSVFALLDVRMRLDRIASPATGRLSADAGLAPAIGARLARMMDRVPRPAADFLDWFTLGAVRHHFHQVKVVTRHRTDLQAIFLECAGIDADRALARYLDTRADWCWTGEDAGIHLVEAVHPLLDAARPLTVTSAGNILLTGQNGAGKSTLLRMIGLNAMTARAFGFCHAKSARLPDLGIYASLRNDDSLFAGESLYVAELRRARELLAIRSTLPGLFLIDEVFRGTNYLESVAASAAFLDELGSRGIVLVSTHHGVLAPLLEHRFTTWHLVRDADTGQVLLGEGVLQRTNGIAMLAECGFDPIVRSKAEKVFDWLSHYLAHPTADVIVLHEEKTNVARG